MPRTDKERSLRSAKLLEYVQQNPLVTDEILAKKFNVSQRDISGINLGEYKIQTNYTYPLRKEKIIVFHVWTSFICIRIYGLLSFLL